MATSDGSVTKIYSLQTVGYDGVLSNLQNLSKAFAAVRQEKERLNKLSGQIEDPAKLANINAQLDKLTIQERQLTQEIKSQIAVSDRMRVVRQSEADGTNKSVSAFAKLNQSYKKAKADMEDLAAEFGPQSEQALKAAASFKIYRDQLDEITKLRKSGGKQPLETPVVSTSNIADVQSEQERTAAATGTVVTDEEQQQLQEQLAATQAYTAAKKGATDATIDNTTATQKSVLADDEKLTTTQQLSQAILGINEELTAANVAIKENAEAYEAGTITEEEYLGAATQLNIEQTTLKARLAETRSEFLLQIKSTEATATSIAELKTQVALLTKEYNNLSVAERKGAEGQKLAGTVKQMNTEINEGSKQLGNFSTNTERAFSRFTSLDGIVGKLVGNIGRMGIHFLAFSLIIKSVEFLIEKISDAFDKMSGKFDKAAVASKGLQDALGDNTYQDAVTNIQRLGVEVDLASKGLYSQKEALDDYNKSLGDALGKANSFADVQKKISDKALTGAYIEAMLYRAAATKILQQASEDAAKAAIENQKDVDVQKSPQGKVVYGGRTGIKINADGSSTTTKTTAADLAQQDLEKRNKVTKDNNDKYISIVQDFYKKVGVLEKKFHLNTSGTKTTKEKTDELSTAEQNALKKIDSLNALALAKENTRYEKLKETQKLSVQDEVDHLTNLKDINNQFDAERIAAVKGKNAEEEKYRAETSLKIIKNTNDTFDKVKELRLKHYDEEKEQLKKQYEETQAAYKKQFEDESNLLKKKYEAGTAGSNLDNQQVQKSPASSETQKAISQKDFDDTELQRAKQYYADLEEAAIRNKQDLAKIEEDKNKTLADLRTKGILDSENIQKAYLSDIEQESENEQSQRLIKAGEAIIKLYENRKLTTAQREAEIQDIKRKYEADELTGLKAFAQKELVILKALYDAQIISEKEYLEKKKKLEGAVQQAEENVASEDHYKKNNKLERTIAPQTGQGLGGLGQTLLTSKKLLNIDPNSVLGKTIGDSFSFADEAMSSYFDEEQRRIEQSLKLQERIIDKQKEAALSHAQSSAEASTIDRQYEAKKLAAERAAFEKQKGVQRQQAKVSLLEQIGNAWAASFQLGAVAAPFYAGAMSILALGRYALQVSAIDAQQFATGGQVQPIALSNGRISTVQNIPRQSNGDNVLATVKTGEVILNEDQQRRAGGSSFFRSLGVPGFASGGAINFNPYPYAPDFKATSYYTTINQNNNAEVVEEIRQLRQDVNDHQQSTDARIDRMEVYQVTRTVTSAQKKEAKQTSVCRL